MIYPFLVWCPMAAVAALVNISCNLGMVCCYDNNLYIILHLLQLHTLRHQSTPPPLKSSALRLLYLFCLIGNAMHGTFPLET